MKIELNRSHLSIKELATVDLPDFTVLIGRNGVGKTHLLEAIKAGHASIPGIQTSEIEKYDICSFQPKESEGTGWDGANFAQRTVEKYFSTSPDSALVYRFNNTFTSIMIDGILVRNQNGHHFKTSQTGLER